MTGGRARRIAVLKPDFGVNGGFERVVDHVEANSDYTQPKVADDGEKIDKNEKRAKEEEK